MDETTLLWAGKFLTLLKMNLSEDDFGTLIYLIRKALKNMLNKRYGISNAQIVDALSNQKEDELEEPFLIPLKMNLSKEDYEMLTSLINKAHKNMLLSNKKEHGE